MMMSVLYNDRIDMLDIDSDRQHLCLGPVVKCNTKYNTTSSFDSFPLSLSPSYSSSSLSPSSSQPPTSLIIIFTEMTIMSLELSKGVSWLAPYNYTPAPASSSMLMSYLTKDSRSPNMKLYTPSNTWNPALYWCLNTAHTESSVKIHRRGEKYASGCAFDTRVT